MGESDWLRNEATDASARLLLAHGAGAPMDSPFMDTIAEQLAQRGIEVLRFEFPYMAQRRQGGSKRPPNAQGVLLDSWREAIAQQPGDLPLFIGGKSLGGRMASLIADEQAVAGLICLGYPFHPSGKPDKLRTEHLQQLKTPTLIVQGERDSLGNREEVGGYPLSAAITLHWLADGDHSFKPRKASGHSWQQHLHSVAQACAAFILG